MVTLAVQAAGIAIIATGMVLVIVSRNIDLSVGSLVGLIAMTLRPADDRLVPAHLRASARTSRSSGSLALAHRDRASGPPSAPSRASSSPTSACPSFIVTLGGLLSIRGLVWYQSQGAAVSGLDPTFQLIGGGAQGSVGGTITWLLGDRRLRRDRRPAVQRPPAAPPLRLPGPADVGGGPARRSSAAPRRSGSPAFANNNFWPEGLANRIATEQNWGPTPAGGWQIPTGFPFPIVLLIGVTLVMSFVATRRRFGRYVYAYGGNPDAAELAGINTRWTILKTYVLMGILCALAAAIAAARLNGATLDIGVSYELYVIAAAVVGGTSFAGGIGTIPGAVLGAFVMQSLAYGLSFIGRQLARPERGRRHRADRRGRLRHAEPPARLMTAEQEDRPMTVAARTPIVEMQRHQRRLRRRARRARGDASTCTPARSSAWSAATAPASRP